MTRPIGPLVLLAAGSLLAACSLTGPAPGNPAADAGGLLPFGTAVLERLATASNGNAAIAPVNLAIALDAVAEVAAPSERERIRGLLWSGTAEARDHHGTLASLALALAGGNITDDPAVTLRGPMALFADTDTRLNPQAVARLHASYGAAVETVAFADPAASDRINAWVSDATAGGIPTIVDRLPAGTAFVLAAALQFKGTWTDAFDPARTADWPFATGDGRQVTVPTMEIELGRIACRDGPGWRSVRLPYGRGDLQAVIVVPAAGPAALGAALAAAPAALDTATTEAGGYALKPGSVALPRFTVAAGADLKPVLEAIGLAGALDTPAALAGFATPAPMVSQIQHRVRIAVDEAGTVASAATAVVATRALPDPASRCDLAADRPFLFAVQDRRTAAPLFLAWITDPRGTAP